MNHATKKWIVLKISSIALIPLMLWTITSLVSVYDQSYSSVVNFFTSVPNACLFSSFLIFAYLFFAITISEIFEDYIHNEKLKNLATRAFYLFAIIVPVITILSIYKLN